MACLVALLAKNKGGRPKGSKSDKATVLARKVLWGKKGDDPMPRVERLFKKLLDGEYDPKEGDMILKALTMLMGYGHDRPAQRAHMPEKQTKGARVMVLPDKKSETDWMADHGQAEVVDMSAPVKPN